MATRKKSIDDIISQYNRIARLREDLAERDGNRAVQRAQSESFDRLTSNEYVDAYRQGASRQDSRDKRAFDTATRYIRNIKKSKSYSNAKSKAQGKGDEERSRLQSAAQGRKYSSNTYKGLNKG